MKASELIERLKYLVKEHGDSEVLLDVSAHGLKAIEEVDVDAEDTGIIIWTAAVEYPA